MKTSYIFCACTLLACAALADELSDKFNAARKVNDQQTAKEVCTEALAADSLDARAHAMWLERRALTEQALKDFEAAYNDLSAASKLSAEAGNIGNAHNLRMAMIRALGNLNRYGEAMELAKQEAALPNIAEKGKERWIIDVLAALPSWPASETPEKVAEKYNADFDALFEKALALELPAANVRDVHNQAITRAARASADEKPELLLAVAKRNAADERLSIAQRLAPWGSAINAARGIKKDNKRVLAPVVEALEFIEKIPQEEIPQRELSELYGNMRSAYEVVKDSEARNAMLRKILALPGAAPRVRLDSVRLILPRAISGEGGAAAAEKIIRDSLTATNLTADVTYELLCELVKLRNFEGNADAVLAVANEAAKYNIPGKEKELKIYALKTLERFEEVADIFKSEGNLIAAAGVLRSEKAPEETRAKALELYRKLLEDEEQPLGARCEAYRALKCKDEKYFDMFASNVTDAIRYYCAYAIGTPGGYGFSAGNSRAYFGDWEEVARCYDSIKRLEKTPPTNEKELRDFNWVLKNALADLKSAYFVQAFAALGRADKALTIARELEANKDAPTNAVYYAAAIGGLLALPPNATEAQVSALLGKINAEKRFESLPYAKRAELLNRAGSALVLAKRESARSLSAAIDALYKPQPKPRAKVVWADAQVNGIADWDNVSGGKIEWVKLERDFGGSTDFLATDVGTGDRGVGVGGDREADAFKSAAEKRPEMAFLATPAGVNIRLRSYKSNAAEIAAGLAGAGSYEGYIAAGEKKPYICFLIQAGNGEVSFWNCTYDTREHRRLEDDDRSLYNTEHRVLADGFETYLFFSWKLFPGTIPGEAFDFESILWGGGANGSSPSWGGSVSVHGRSRWGKLDFDIPAAGKVAIKRQFIFNALKVYKSAKSERGKEGSLAHWADSSVGDVDFYNAVLAPLCERLDAAAALVKVDMDAVTVEKIYAEAAVDWYNIDQIVAAERMKWLAEKFTK